MIFPFKYSIFGPMARAPFPQEQPIFEQSNSWGSIGLCNVRGYAFKMHIFPSGVGISWGWAKIFIPKINILSVEATFMGYKLIHNSPELRNPVIFSSKENFEKIQSILGK
ncbi:MAG: hypothetical protein HQL15_10160 [Candidatus Omnitrophica bacterium]|nr:hypothetical protein [Candidatus Omnitrophota bacterium]